MLTLHNLTKNQSARRVGKRRGRGSASGAGNYSGRGIKGQKARSGGRVGLKIKSIKSYLLRIPKVRGFKSFHPKRLTINLNALEKHFADGATVNLRALIKLGLVRDSKAGLKVLAQGKLSKKLKVEAQAFSRAAQTAIEQVGGQAIALGAKVKSVVDKAEKN